VRRLIPRLRHQLKHHGVKGTLDAGIRRAQTKLYVDETHVWYELFLGGDRPQRTLRPGLELIRARAADLPLLEEFPSVNEYRANQRIEAGNDLWLVLDDRQPVFACWIFHDSVPVLAARSGHLALPPKTVCLEDSIALPSYRGRGVVAPSAWSQVADGLEKTGVESIITKVEADNKAMRFVLAKSGFREIAVMRHRRAVFWRYTTVRPEIGATADWLAERLAP
jgi:hypothetical protein